LEQVPGTPVESIERLCVNPVQLPHPPPKVGFGRFDEQVVVIPHQAVCMADPPGFFDHGGEKPRKALPVQVIAKDHAASIASRRNVVNGTGIFDA
jgi:hypothetical protein